MQSYNPDDSLCNFSNGSDTILEYFHTTHIKYILINTIIPMIIYHVIEISPNKYSSVIVNIIEINNHIVYNRVIQYKYFIIPNIARIENNIDIAK